MFIAFRVRQNLLKTRLKPFFEFNSVAKRFKAVLLLLKLASHMLEAV